MPAGSGDVPSVSVQTVDQIAVPFRKCGGQVEMQRFRARHPVDGSAVPMANLIVRWHPQSTERILLTRRNVEPYSVRMRLD